MANKQVYIAREHYTLNPARYINNEKKKKKLIEIT